MNEGQVGPRDFEIEPTEGGIVSADPGSDYLITVQVDERYEERVDAGALHSLAIQVLRAEGRAGPLELGVVVTTDDEVLALNRQYLGHDYKTDVISFGMEDEEPEVAFLTPAERPPYLGDVVISYDRAAEQALEYGHSIEQEVATLLVHGVLHLLGWDDSDEEARARMHARQDSLMRNVKQVGEGY
ncbi:MAG: rRNA maturation RNase YbeY [Chloroflexia bacterium]